MPKHCEYPSKARLNKKEAMDECPGLVRAKSKTMDVYPNPVRIKKEVVDERPKPV
ncbi:hypothetical protein [Maribellus maritimus]|uniref:hypothetical protein n=1 Tax=Maribellus maritimus TaxID=2870838 RepID=UPI001EEC8216|nr:hypothetical protein [Maribellus maritimus]MCG6188189.1 hypothetical protein [Maribellus maritimus]